MKKIKHIGKDAEKIANGITYHTTLVVIGLVMFFGACYILNGIIDPMLETLEKLAENALRMAKAIVKILVVSVLVIAIYKVFIEPQKGGERE